VDDCNREIGFLEEKLVALRDCKDFPDEEKLDALAGIVKQIQV
jgi:hypothetical protein